MTPHVDDCGRNVHRRTDESPWWFRRRSASADVGRQEGITTSQIHNNTPINHWVPDVGCVYITHARLINEHSVYAMYCGRTALIVSRVSVRVSAFSRTRGTHLHMYQ